MSKYGRRRSTPLEQGDCPPNSMPFDYNDPTFLAAAQRAGQHIHRSWIDQAIGDVVLQVRNLWNKLNCQVDYALLISQTHHASLL